MSNNNTVSNTAAVMAADIDQYIKTEYFTKKVHYDFDLSPDVVVSAVNTDVRDNPIIRDVELNNFFSDVSTAIKNNVIQDTDKVFFNGSSAYPRNNFNRYSENARRIQNAAKADKVVIADPSSIHFSAAYRSEGLYNESLNTFYQFELGHFVTALNKAFNTGDDTEKNARIAARRIDKGLESKIRSQSNYWFNAHAVVSAYKEELLEYFSILTGGQIGWGHLNSNYTTVPEKALLDLFIGPDRRPLNEYVTDAAVNAYIDGNKPTLTPDQMDNILPLLKGDSANVGIALKLLENMNLANNSAEFTGMMMVAFLENEGRIKSTPAWNYTGIKNLRKTFTLNKLDNLSNLDVVGKLSRIGDIYNNVPTKHKEKFKEITNPTVVNLIKRHCGLEVTNLLNI